MDRSVVKAALLLAAVGLSVGCRGDGGGGGGGGDGLLSVDGSKTIGDLTDSEVATITQETQQAYREAVTDEEVCSFAGLITEVIGGGSVDCETARDDCLSDPDEVVEPDELPDAHSREACDVTVAELETCLQDQLAAYEQQLSGITCDGELPTDSQDPPSCMGIWERCPEVFGSPE